MSKSFNAKFPSDEARRAYYREAMQRWRELHPDHRQKSKDYMAVWHQEHKSEQAQYRYRYWREVVKPGPKRREYMLKKLYGMTNEQFDALLFSQCGRCAICGDVFGEDVPHVDHDHETNVVRGLLCGKCNTALGSFREDRNVLLNAITYIAA